METPEVKANITFMSIAEFKNAVNSPTLEVRKNEKGDGTVTHFVSGTNSRTWKAQCKDGGLDITKPMAFLVSDGVLDEACLVNTKNQTKLLATL